MRKKKKLVEAAGSTIHSVNVEGLWGVVHNPQCECGRMGGIQLTENGITKKVMGLNGKQNPFHTFLHKQRNGRHFI